MLGRDSTVSVGGCVGVAILPAPLFRHRHFLYGASYAVLLGCAFFLPFTALLPGWGFWENGLYLPDWQRVFQWGAILVMLLSVVSLGRNISLVSNESRWLFLLWGTISLSGLLSVAFAQQPFPALLDWAWLNAIGVLVVVTRFLFNVNFLEHRKMVLSCALMASVLYVFWFFVGNSGELFTPEYPLDENEFFGFTNIRYFSDFQAPLLFLAPVGCFFILKSQHWRWPALFLVGLLYSLAFLAGSRSVLLGQLLAHSVLFLALGKNYLKYFRHVAACWMMGLVLYVGIFMVYAPWVDSPDGNFQIPWKSVATARLDSSGRSDLMVKAWHLIKDNPVLGVGGRHYGCYKSRPDTIDSANPHNALIQLAVEWGGVPTLGITGLLGYLLFCILRRLRNLSADSHFEMAMVASLFALLGHSMVNGVINGAITQMQLVMLVGWACHWCFRPVTANGGRGLSGNFGLPAFSLALMLVVSLLISLELAALPDGNRSYAVNNPPTSFLASRFWQQGWLLPLCGVI